MMRRCAWHGLPQHANSSHSMQHKAFHTFEELILGTKLACLPPPHRCVKL